MLQVWALPTRAEDVEEMLTLLLSPGCCYREDYQTDLKEDCQE